MADNKKYYWLKLKRDFFKRHDIRIIEKMPNGKDYILFYLKMLLESIDHEGNLRFSDTIPYDNNMLSVITDTNIDIVKSAMELFVGLNMVEVLDDNTIYMNEVEKLIGSETRWAEKKRLQRQNEDNVPNLSIKCPTEIEIEKEKEKDIELDLEKENKKVDCQQIADLYNTICVSFPSIRTLSESRKKAIKARLNTYSVDDFKTVFENAEKSSFLKGGNDRNWTATFDWLIKDTNMAKVLDGNYADKQGKRRKEIIPDWFIDETQEKLNKSFEEEMYNKLPVYKKKPKTAADDESIRARAESLKEQITGDVW